MKENELIYNWAKHVNGEKPTVVSQKPHQVDIDDETLRDGLQGTGC